MSGQPGLQPTTAVAARIAGRAQNHTPAWHCRQREPWPWGDMPFRAAVVRDRSSMIAALAAV
jgi:hypothetical protein